MSIFEDVPQNVIDDLEAVKEKYFSDLFDARIKVLWDTRTKKKKWLAKIYKASEMIRYFTADEVGEEDGLDYVIVLDKRFYTAEGITEADRERILRHELRHAWFRPTKRTRKSQYVLRKHNCETFWEEIELNTKEGEPQWDYKMGEIHASLYDPENEEGED
jgi:hypothetical protein